MKRKLHLQWVVAALMISLLIGSCKKTDVTNDNSNEIQPTAVLEAKGYFESTIQKSNPGAVQTESVNSSHSLSKSPVWNQSYLTSLSTGPAVVIPLKYSQ